MRYSQTEFEQAEDEGTAAFVSIRSPLATSYLQRQRPIRLSEGWLIIEHIPRSTVYTSQTNTSRRPYGNTLTLRHGSSATVTNASVSLLQGSGKLKFGLSDVARQTWANYTRGTDFREEERIGYAWNDNCGVEKMFNFVGLDFQFEKWRVIVVFI